MSNMSNMGCPQTSTLAVNLDIGVVLISSQTLILLNDGCQLCTLDCLDNVSALIAVFLLVGKQSQLHTLESAMGAVAWEIWVVVGEYLPCSGRITPLTQLMA